MVLMNVIGEVYKNTHAFAKNCFFADMKVVPEVLSGGTKRPTLDRLTEDAAASSG
jgi:hypothetical protein